MMNGFRECATHDTMFLQYEMIRLCSRLVDSCDMWDSNDDKCWFL